VPVEILKINGLSDFVVLGIEVDPALCQFPLSSKKVSARCAEGKMEHPNVAIGPGVSGLTASWKKGKRGSPFADKNRNPVPHPVVQTFEAKHLNVPLRCSFDVANTERDVINAFNLNHV
jgi:hypothetical protein